MNEKVHSYLKKAYSYAKLAFERCFTNVDTYAPADKTAALAMAAACTAQFAAAASVYLSSNSIYDENVLKIFRQFENVTKEVRNVYHQEQCNATALFLEMNRLESIMAANGFEV